jgi:iron complex outermembrane receptor protein
MNFTFMHKTLLLLIIGVFITLSSLAQNTTGNIYGHVVSANDSSNAEFVNVGLKGTANGTLTNSKGQFTISNIEAGTYTLVFQLLGYETIEKTITVTAGESINAGSISLVYDLEYQEIEIIGKTNKFAEKESDYPSRMPLENLENPQVYNVVTKELMQEQVITNFDDAVKNAPGINKLWTSTGRGSDGAGYFSMRGFSVQPSMINGIAGISNGGIDPANIERLETIKGPSSTLFGSSFISFGGLINIVTKRPYDTRGGEVSFTSGSYSLNRLTFDVNTPLNKNKTALFRLNGAHHYEGSFQDAGFKKTTFLAPSFLFKANKRLIFFLNAELYNAETTNPLSVFLNRTRPLEYRTIDELNFDFKKSYTSNDITIKTPTLNLYGQISYKLSNAWVAQTNLARSVRKSDGYYSYVMFLEPVKDSALTRYISDQNSISTTTDIQQNFIGDFKIGSLRNRMVVGIDFMNTQTTNNSSAYIVFDKVTTTPGVVDPDYALLTQQAVDARLATSTTPTKTGVNSWTYSAYVSDVLNITEKLLVMGSLRFDYFDNKGTQNFATAKTTGKFEQAALSPKLGVVYQLVKNKVSVFGNYMNGFKNVAPVVQPLASVSGTFKPQQANQLEAGVKLDVFNHKLSLTASYYDILVTNMTRTEQLISGGTPYMITVQDGSQKSKGLEFDLIANPIKGFNLIAGYGYNDSKMVKAAPTVEGLRPTTAGPQHLVNLWASYTFLRGTLKGFGLGLGGNYASENVIASSSLIGKFTLPSYAVANAAVFYNTPTYRLAIKVDNLTDKAYYIGWSTIERQLPRRIMASVALKF